MDLATMRASLNLVVAGPWRQTRPEVEQAVAGHGPTEERSAEAATPHDGWNRGAGWGWLDDDAGLRWRWLEAVG
jgi:hypothetical protein